MPELRMIQKIFSALFGAQKAICSQRRVDRSTTNLGQDIEQSSALFDFLLDLRFPKNLGQLWFKLSPKFAPLHPTL